MAITPNPASDFISINFTGNFNDGGTLEIYNLLGNQVKSIPVKNADVLTIAIDNLPSGIYFVKTQSTDGTAVTYSKFQISK